MNKKGSVPLFSPLIFPDELLNDTCGHPEGDELVYSVKEKGRNQASIPLISDKTNGQTQHSHQRALGLEI
jgi:hypothetical protein